jgi:hypothetical protein
MEDYMTEATQAPAAAEAVDSPVLEFEISNVEGKHTLDCTTIPAPSRLHLLKSAARSYIANRVNAAFQRHQKDEKVKAWAAYDAAVKNDSLQTLVPVPTFERPTAPDLLKTMNEAVADLVAGNIRQSTGEPKKREAKDPLIAHVTKAVVREVFEARKAADPKYKYLTAQTEVGSDGIAYLNRMIDTKAAAAEAAAAGTGAGLRSQLEKMRDERYVTPAKIMLGMVDTKTKGLPSIL